MPKEIVFTPSISSFPIKMFFMNLALGGCSVFAGPEVLEPEAVGDPHRGQGRREQHEALAPHRRSLRSLPHA